MPFNATGESFIPLGGPFAVPPTITEGTQYSGLTTAQLNVLPSLTSVSVTVATTTVQAAARRNTMTIIVPIDQQAVTLGNQNPVSGLINEPPQTIWPVSGSPQPVTSAATMTAPPTGFAGFTLPPGNSMVLAPYNDPLYASVPSRTATLFYITS